MRLLNTAAYDLVSAKQWLSAERSTNKIEEEKEVGRKQTNQIENIEFDRNRLQYTCCSTQPAIEHRTLSNTEYRLYVNDMRFFYFAAAIVLVLSMVDCRRFIRSTMMMHGTHASNVTVATFR